MEKVAQDTCTVEVFSRVTGFFRPVEVWNNGKKEEFKERKMYSMKGAPNEPFRTKHVEEGDAGGV